ncbi:MAG TPA: fasciclin domain-containing protein, partial [Pyrinomonadaceae bacterium]|nr:fasciclin domain-containing protein [Pyrinomonadaceae bacterium]
LQSLLQPENREQLSKILTYHVVPGRVTARQVKSMRGAKTVQGARVHFASTHDGVRVNNANVVKTDVAAGNGIIHVIDAVLMPK